MNPLRKGAIVAGGLATGVFGLLYAYPVVRVVVEGFHFAAISDVVSDHRIRASVWFSCWQATLSTVCVLCFAVPMAGFLTHRKVRGRRVLLGALVAPFTLPTVVVGAAIRETLPRSLGTGVVAIICAHIFYNVGMATLIVLPRWEQIDSTLTEAASTLGASRWRSFRTVTVPLLAPAIRNAALLTFTLSFTSFGVVLLLGGSHRATIDVEIYRQALQRLRLDRASVLSAFQLLVLGTLAFVASRVSVTTFSSRTSRLKQRPALGHFQSAGNLVRVASFTAVFGLLLSPLIALLTRSLREPRGTFGFANFRALAHRTPGSGMFDSPIASFVPSLRSAMIAATIAVLIGGALAVADRETKGDFKGDSTLFSFLGSLPLATSSVQLGLGFLLAFASAPMAWRSRWFAVPMVQAVVAVPFVIRQLSPSLAAVPRGLREAATTLGARPWRAWFDVDLRLVRRAVGSAFALAIAISLGEFGAAIFLARPQSTTVPLAIAKLSGRPGVVLQGQAAALAVLLGALTMLVVLLGQGFRSSKRVAL